MSGYIYLASPYSHPDLAVRVARYDAACKASAQLMVAGAIVFCPIAHTHPISSWVPERVQTHEFWMAQDLPMLARASGLAVLQIDGWLESRGVNEEIEFAIKHSIPVKYIRP